MAAALVEYAQSRSAVQPNPEKVAEFRILPGEGIYGEIDGRHIYIGNKRALARGSYSHTHTGETTIVHMCVYIATEH
jgi:Cd2+/Zn2+-exporting ATPase